MTDLEALRAFALEMLKGWPDVGAIEGWDIEAAALKCGLLIPTQVTEPCSESCCACLRYGEGFPMTCNKFGPVLRA